MRQVEKGALSITLSSRHSFDIVENSPLKIYTSLLSICGSFLKLQSIKVPITVLARVLRTTLVIKCTIPITSIILKRINRIIAQSKIFAVIVA